MSRAGPTLSVSSSEESEFGTEDQHFYTRKKNKSRSNVPPKRPEESSADVGSYANHSGSPSPSPKKVPPSASVVTHGKFTFRRAVDGNDSRIGSPTETHYEMNDSDDEYLASIVEAQENGAVFEEDEPVRKDLVKDGNSEASEKNEPVEGDKSSRIKAN